MSQKGEKYARRMERRVDKLEQDVAAITTEQTTQGVGSLPWRTIWPFTGRRCPPVS